MVEGLTKDKIFQQALESVMGRHIEIVTGRNNYTISKTKHAALMQNDGIYLILEKNPDSGRSRIFDKAFILPATVVNGQFATNDPAKIKSSFTLAGDRLRVRFHTQKHKIYEFFNPHIQIKPLIMATSRQNVRITREECKTLANHNGGYIYLCTAPNGQLIDIVTKSATAIQFKENQLSKEIPIDLTGAGLERLNLYRNYLSQINKTIRNQDSQATTCNACISSGGGDCATCDPEPKKPICFRNPEITPNIGAHSVCLTCPFLKKCQEKEEPVETPQKFNAIDTYLSKGTSIIISLPEGEKVLQLTCIITDAKRVTKVL